jgi:hypothetical protein
MMVRTFLAVLTLLGIFGIAGPAHAYRPFDGTDAAVTGPGEIGFELQPAGLLREGSQTRLVTPAAPTIVSLGVAEGWEVNAQGQVEIPVGHLRGRTTIVDTGVFAKAVLRPGFLQEQPGPSVATEFGVLLPELNGQSGAGASWAMIISQGGSWGAVHLNLQPEVTLQQHFASFLDVIVEGPGDWPVRPVAELFVTPEIGGPLTRSALIGAIWQVRDNLAFDAGLRGARVGSQSVAELRLGVSFAFDAW